MIILKKYVNIIFNDLYFVGLINLSDDKSQIFKLKHAEEIGDYEMGFLPNGNLILVSLDNYKIYSYSLLNKPTRTTTPWGSPQIYDIEVPESVKTTKDAPAKCYVCQTK